MDRCSTASLGQWVPHWTAQALRCLRVGQPGPEQPGQREDGGGGKDREVLGATVRGQRGAGWEKEEGGREGIRVLMVQGQAVPSLSCPNSYGDRNEDTLPPPSTPDPLPRKKTLTFCGVCWNQQPSSPLRSFRCCWFL